MKPSVFISGCNGYIGSVLTPFLLNRGHEVVGVDLPDTFRYASSYIGNKRFRFVAVDTRDSAIEKAIKSADVVIPLAAIVGFAACDRQDVASWDVNAAAIERMVSLLTPYQRVIYPNTNSGYGARVKQEVYTEESPLEPNSLYGKSKLMGERYVLDHPLGVSFRLASVFGVSPKMRDDLMLHDFVKKVANKQEIELFEPNARRNFVHVRDVCRAFAEAIVNHELSGVYNLGLPDVVSKQGLLQKIHEVTGLVVNYKIVNGTDPDKRDYIVSSKKLMDTGFRFEYSIEDGINEYHQYLR